MNQKISKAAVIGAGVMGRGIAAHLAGCGIDCLLLDIDKQFAVDAIKALPKTKPSLIFDPKDARRITPGSIADDLPKLAECDWVIEVIIEKLEPKQALYAQIETHMKPGQIISSNTSGISWSLLTEGRSAQFKQHFCITHFFNPVRYLKLVELVGGPDTDPKVIAVMESFLSDTLGKGVVHAKDTPNFIANRIGVQGMTVALHQLYEQGWKLEHVDKVMGPPTGRPKSAMFRTADLVGLDTLAHVARNTYEMCPQDECRELYRLPSYVETMIANGAIGEKSGQGFYKKDRDADGKRVILALDAQTQEYRTQEKFKTPSLGAAREIENPAERIATVVKADDDAGAIAWPLVSENLAYAANRVPEIADEVYSVDNAMCWGFGWEIGPFAMWDALGVQYVVDRLRDEGRAVPQLALNVLESGDGCFYRTRDGQQEYFDVLSKSYRAIPTKPGVIVLDHYRAQNAVVDRNEGASLFDLGDGVFGVEFHSKMNAIDADLIGMMNAGLDRAEAEGVGLVIGNDGPNFCVGANLMLIFMEAQAENWDTIDGIVRQFQGLCQRMRFAKVPVVVAPYNMALGGGCEVVLGGTHVRASAETYTGLVELGVGLIPAGAGCKNMILRAEESAMQRHNPNDQIWMSPLDGGPFPKVRAAFEAIGFAKVSTSAKEAKKIGYLRRQDRISLDRAGLIGDAKSDVLEYAQNYTPAVARDDIVLPGQGGYYALLNAIAQAKDLGHVTPYDEVLASKLAHVLTGANHPNTHLATEQDILDREREAFLSLCGDERTHARIQHMLLKGKPLRN